MQTRNAIVDAWYERTVETYPAEARPQLLRVGDRFRNPVGALLKVSLEAVFHEIDNEMDEARVRRALDPIVRLRAVQDFTPAEAISFASQLREVAREQHVTFPDHEQRLDRLSRLALDTYKRCREQIDSIRRREAASPLAHLRCRS